MEVENSLLDSPLIGKGCKLDSDIIMQFISARVILEDDQVDAPSVNRDSTSTNATSTSESILNSNAEVETDNYTTPSISMPDSDVHFLVSTQVVGSSGLPSILTDAPTPMRADFKSLASSPSASFSPTVSQSPTRHSRMHTQPHDSQPSTPLFAKSRLSNAMPESKRTFWEYLSGELHSSDMDEAAAAKCERVANFLSVPYELEKFLFYGYLICLDSFLHVFTILPLRIAIAFARLPLSISKGRIPSSHKCDILKGFLILACSFILSHISTAQVYHSIRAQAIIKLYVIFNVLEICDKLCCAFGHDILDSLFSRTQSSSTDGKTSVNRSIDQLSLLTHFVVALLYVFVHSIILLGMVMTLNVSVNSYSNALLTLLLSNQFVEIKGSVFKKFERDNLFQLSCSDTVERFQLAIFMAIITIRNYMELTGGVGVERALSYIIHFSSNIFTPSFIFSNLPEVIIAPITHTTVTDTLLVVYEYCLSSVTILFSSPNYKMMEGLLTPAIVVLGTEILVDWLKHAFITKFNLIRPNVYQRFTESLFRDLVCDGKLDREGHVDQSPAVARRIGFVSIPLACLVIRIALQMLSLLSFPGYLSFISVKITLSLILFCIFLGVKLVLGMTLLRVARMHIEQLKGHERTGSISQGMLKNERKRSVSVAVDRAGQDEKLDALNRFTLIKRIV